MEKIEILVLIYKPNLNYLGEQIESLNRQTYKNFYVTFLIDGNSTDNLVNYIKLRCNEFLYQIIVNKINFGVDYNIFNYIKKTKSDILFFCDQDDVWLPEKVVTYLNYFSRDSNLALICSNTTLWAHSSSLKNTSISGKLQPYTVLGHTIAIRTSFYNINKIWFLNKFPVYDTYICFYTKFKKYKYHFISDSYTYYRLHSNQLTYNKIKSKRDLIFLRLNFLFNLIKTYYEDLFFIN